MIRLEDLRAVLENVPSRASFVSFRTVTTPRMRKTVNGRGTPYNEYHDEDGNCTVRKVSEVRGLVNFVYANSVNNQREREGVEPDFEPEPRRWGSRVDGTPLVRHVKNGEERFYLEVKVESATSTYYDENWNEIDREEIEEYLYSSSGSSRQGVEDRVILRDYRLENVDEITMFGETYDVIRTDGPMIG
jgi:hypothetical protein